MKRTFLLVFISVMLTSILCGCEEKTKCVDFSYFDIVTTSEEIKDNDTEVTTSDELQNDVEVTTYEELRNSILPTSDSELNRNKTKEKVIVNNIDFKLLGKYDNTLPYEENHTDGIIYYTDSIYVALENINTNVIKNDNISKVEIWNYDGTEKIENLAITFSTEIKEIEFINVPLGLKAIDKKVFAIKILPTVDYKNFNNPIEYNKELSVAVYYIDEYGTEQIVWVQFEKIIAYT